MAALPYMQFYVADYLADTMHLNTEEHGAYLLLIFNYWQTGKPLIAKSERLATVARMSNDRWADVEIMLKPFFIERDGFWIHPRIEADLDHVASIQEKASKAGKASALARKRKQEIKNNARSTPVATDVETDVEQPYQHESNHTDPDPDPDPKTYTPLAMLVDMGVNKKIAQDWLKVRKTKRLAATQTAFDQVMREAEKAGMTMNDAVTRSAQESWGGFKASWLENKGNGYGKDSGNSKQAQADQFTEGLKNLSQTG